VGYRTQTRHSGHGPQPSIATSFIAAKLISTFYPTIQNQILIPEEKLTGSVLATNCLIINFRHNVYEGMIARYLRPTQFFFGN